MEELGHLMEELSPNGSDKGNYQVLYVPKCTMNKKGQNLTSA